MRRGFAIALVFLALILIPGVILTVVVPPVVTQGSELVGNSPRYANQARTFFERNGTLRGIESKYKVGERVQAAVATLPSKLGDVAGALSAIGIGIATSLVALGTILVLTAFILGSGGWVRAALEQQPPERAERVERVLREMGQAVGRYVGGVMAQ